MDKGNKMTKWEMSFGNLYRQTDLKRRIPRQSHKNFDDFSLTVSRALSTNLSRHQIDILST